MKKAIAFLSFVIFAHSQLVGQTSNNSLSGIVIDNTTKEKIEFASIRLLTPKDSVFVAGVSTNDKGEFRVSVKPDNYLLKVSFMGYKDYVAEINTSRNASLGQIYLEEDAVLLNEAMVEAKVIEIAMKGDTIEYNADSYKVQESAVVEDLLKKMPGVEIDADGKIMVNGKEVKKIMVDGKEFFSDDPKIASKNLPAQMVDKLQVLDKKSDMSLMTGFDDGDEETVINLTVKKGMKEGVFGSVMGGYGSEERYEGAANVNYMRDNTQVSFIGGANNTNNAGSSDLASAMFSGSGGGRGGNMRFGGSNGVTESLTGGFNFATEHSNKLKWGGDIRYGDTDNSVITNTITEYTTQKDPRSETSESWGNNLNKSFAANLKFEWTPDSLTKVIFRPTMQYNTSKNTQGSDGSTIFEEDATKNYSSVTGYSSEGKGYRLNGTLDFSRKLNSKGRVFSIGVSGGLNSSDNDGFDYTKITYTAKTDSIIDQQFFQNDDSHNWRVFTSFVEPIGRNNYLELSYNISNNISETDKKTYYNTLGAGLTPDYSELDPLYTRYVKNDFLNQNVSLKFKSQREKFNYTLGLGLEPSSSKTILLEPAAAAEVALPRRTYLNLAPSGQFNYLWDKRTNLRIDYRASTNQPTTLQLYDGIYSRSGMNTTSGNPDLKPSFENRINIRFRSSNPEQASFMALFGGFTHTSNAIVSTTTWNDKGGQDMTYNNVDGNMSGNMRFVFNRPLRNRNWSINSMSYVGYNLDNTLISEIDDSVAGSVQTKISKNKAKVLNLQESAGLQFKSDLFDSGLRGNVGYNNMRNSISTKNNRNTFTYGGSYNFTLRTPTTWSVKGKELKSNSYNFRFQLSDISLESDMNYSTNSGYSQGFKQDEWLWNAALSATVFKDKFGSGILRFKMYDILQQRSNISSTYAANSFKQTMTNTISSYFMVNFVYKFQFFKGGIKQADMGGGMERGMGRGMGGGRSPH